MSGRRAKFLWRIVSLTFPNVNDRSFLKNRYRKMKKKWNEMSEPEKNEFLKYYSGPLK